MMNRLFDKPPNISMPKTQRQKFNEFRQRKLYFRVNYKNSPTGLVYFEKLISCVHIVLNTIFLSLLARAINKPNIWRIVRKPFGGKFI